MDSTIWNQSFTSVPRYQPSEAKSPPGFIFYFGFALALSCNSLNAFKFAPRG